MFGNQLVTLSSMPLEAARTQNRERQRARCSLHRHTLLMTYFLQPRPPSVAYHLPIMSSNYVATKVYHYIIALKFKKHPEMCFSILGISKFSQVKTDCPNDIAYSICLTFTLGNYILFYCSWCVCVFLFQKESSLCQPGLSGQISRLFQILTIL